MNILVTGFAPFGGAVLNPSWQAVCLLPDALEGHRIHKRELPVVFGESGDLLEEAAAQTGASLVLMCGVAAGRSRVTPELLAHNERRCTRPDNAGQLYTGATIDPALPPVLATDLPAEAFAEAVRAAGLPAAPSRSAGRYVCNDLYFRFLSRLQSPRCRGLFVHVPAAEDLPPEASAQALLLILREALLFLAQEKALRC